MRLFLAASALLIIVIDPAEPDRFVALTYTLLGLYVVYSAVLYILALRGSPFAARLSPHTHWIDVGWYAVLVAVSSGTSSIFFFGFFFAILVASFSQGFARGLRVALVSAVLFTLIGLTVTPLEANFELNRFLLRPIYLLVLGYMMAYWGIRTYAQAPAQPAKTSNRGGQSSIWRRSDRRLADTAAARLLRRRHLRAGDTGPIRRARCPVQTAPRG